MLKRVSPIQYNRPVTRGRTGPLFITCETDDGSTEDVVAKFSGGCDQGNINLAREVIGACLAGDLGLPVPEPFLIDVPAQWVATVPDANERAKVGGSSPVAFGSRFMTGQFGIWTPGNLISDIMLPTAVSIFVFDAIIQNPDRRSDNPNCLVRGDELRIFDHELAFSHGLIIGWQPPWSLGGLKSMETNGNHIFRAGLKGRIVDYAPIRAAWAALSDARIAGYETALPAEWINVEATAAAAIKLIKDARDNIDAVLEEVKRVLL
ncbi:HipA family kinase [Labrys sp. (in: a-proteobacteria)]|uniref:HipA family kinase n=1 Tax=Labrys sp. (in: a-proteobacteria) TaxID=1917972 RepID=UPI0039E4AABB